MEPPASPFAQVINESRQNKPSIKVAPIKDATLPTSRVYQDLIRQIEYDCNADIAYDTAGRTANHVRARMDTSLYRIHPRHKSAAPLHRSDPEPIQRGLGLQDQVKYDTSDADWKFVITYITKEQHERRFPKAELNEIDFASTTFENPAPNWIALGTNQDMVQLAEYWVRDQINPGSKNPKFEIWRYIINGMEILRGKSAGLTINWIPIIPTWGRQSFVDGMKRTFSLIRPVIDPQRMLNVYVSNLAELIGQMPKAMFTAPTDGIPANSMEDWKNSSYDPVLALLYRVYDQEGRTLPKPERIVNEPPIQAILMGIQQCIDAIKSGMGIFDASLGARSATKLLASPFSAGRRKRT